MKHKRNVRALLAGAGAAVTAVALAFGGALAAQAAPPQPVPTTSNVVITKLEQPSSLGTAATGEQITDLSAYEGINGVVFDYYLVTGTGAGGAYDIGTNAGQQYAAGLDAASAPITTKTGSFPATNTVATQKGVTQVNNLPRGVYVVKEVSAPAGVTPAGDFLLTVPLTNPSDKDAWLDTIYVYPKNVVSSATKSVTDASTLAVGGNIVWTISADIPKNLNSAGTAFVAPDAFEIHDTLTNAELVLVGDPVVQAGGTTLDINDHFTVTPDTTTDPTKTSYVIAFTPDGLDELATALNADPTAQVTVGLTTTVKQATEIANVAEVYPSQFAIDTKEPILTEEVKSKYGSYQINKKSSDGTVTDLSGAVFRVYATKAAAEAGGTDYLKPKDDAGVEHSSWTTDTDGQVTIDGLRYTAWANGAVQAPETSPGVANPLYQTYWLVEITALDGHQLLAEPIEIVIDGDSGTQTIQAITNQHTTGGFVLPLTGGAGTGLLVIGGIALLAVVLLVARKRRASEAIAE